MILWLLSFVFLPTSVQISAPRPGNFRTAPPSYYDMGENSLIGGNNNVDCCHGIVPDWQNQGTINIMACGYDLEGVWQNIPMSVRYQYNGIGYDVVVLNAWNPFSDLWEDGIDMPAYSTNYVINGNTYSYYAPLSTGTYYFNL